MALRPLASAGAFTGPIASSNPLPDATRAGHLLLYIGIYIKRVVDVGEGDFKWAFIVGTANEKPDSKGQKYWMAKVRDFAGLTTVRGCRENALIDLRDEKDLLCRILLAEVEDMEKLHKVMSLPRSPKTIMDDMKWESLFWVKGMLGQLMREGCLKRGLVAWDVVEEEGFELADKRVEFNEKHDTPTGFETWTVDLLNRKESDEWLVRKSESPELEDLASFAKRMNAYWDDDGPSVGSSHIDDKGGKDKKGSDPSPSLRASKKSRSKVREVVAKNKRTEAAESLSKSPTPLEFTTPPEHPVGHGKRKRLRNPNSPSP